METCLDEAIYHYRTRGDRGNAIRYSLRYARQSPRQGKPWKQLVASVVGTK